MSITVAPSPAPTSLGTGAVTAQKVDQGALIASMSGTISESRAVARTVMENLPATPPANLLGKINFYA
jgi:hypothetical protein